jgi:hypothetical protein
MGSGRSVRGTQYIALHPRMTSMCVQAVDDAQHASDAKGSFGVAALLTFATVPVMAALAALFYSCVPKAGLLMLPVLAWQCATAGVSWSKWRLNGRGSLLPRKAPAVWPAPPTTAGSAAA